jgi:hypothetical protein
MFADVILTKQACEYWRGSLDKSCINVPGGDAPVGLFERRARGLMQSRWLIRYAWDVCG